MGRRGGQLKESSPHFPGCEGEEGTVLAGYSVLLFMVTN